MVRANQNIVCTAGVHSAAAKPPMSAVRGTVMTFHDCSRRRRSRNGNAAPAAAGIAIRSTYANADRSNISRS
jgi:hypothetical protein